MYQIMLVDDDSFFCSMLINGTDWKARGFCVACTAENGQQAIEMLHRRHIDLMFVDMCLPSVNGVEIIQYAAAHYPGVTCVAVSSHDDFDFVKESFRSGADDYILKHRLTQQEIARVLDRFLEKRRETGTGCKQDKAACDAAAVDKYLVSLLEGRYMQPDYDFALPDSLGLPRFHSNILLMRFDIADYDKLRARFARLNKENYLERSVCSILQSILERIAAGAAFYHDRDKCFYSMITDERFCSVPFLNDTRELYIQQVNNSLKRYLNAECSCICAPLCGKILDIYYSYVDILKQAHAKIPERAGLKTTDGDRERLFDASLRMLQRYLGYADFDCARRYIAKQFEDGRKLQYAHQDFCQLAVTLYKVSIKCREAFRLAADQEALRKAVLICDMKCVQDMEEFLLETFRDVHDAIIARRTKRYSRHIQNALAIVDQQYHNPALSLDMIADILQLNPPYLSRIFKNEVQTGLSEYINQYRVAKAQDCLILDRMTVKEASARCGFENYTYFFRVFKKLTSLTPKEFCDANVGRADPCTTPRDYSCEDRSRFSARTK